MSDANRESGSENESSPAPDLLTATPRTAYFWGRVAGDGDLTQDCVTVRASDETAAHALATVAGADQSDHSVTARESAHDATVRFEDEYTVRVCGGLADRASTVLGLSLDQPEADRYQFEEFTAHRRQLLRGLLEACGTVCFRESAGSVGVSFVHDDECLLRTVRSLLEDADPHVPTEDLAETSSGGYWFGLADGADIAAFAQWVYAGSEASKLYSDARRQKLHRSVERATGGDVGDLTDTE